jgi:transglutaminase-like putative cysteine protease
VKRIIHRSPTLSVALITVCIACAPLTVEARPQSAQASETSPAQQKAQPAPSKSSQEKTDDSQEPFIIERSITRAVFENDGTDRADLEVVVNVLNEEGVQKFGQLVFGYNAVNQKLDVVSVEVRKAGSSTFTAASAVRDVAPASSGAPAYTAYREKRVTVPGLRPGDTVAYRISRITAIPDAPAQFWFEYDFVKDAIVLDEQLEISVPQNRAVKLKTRPGADPVISEEADRRIYRWKVARPARETQDAERKKQPASELQVPSVQITTFENWEEVGRWYAPLERDRATPDASIRTKAEELTRDRSTDLEKIEALYDFVATKIRTVSLPFGLGSYQPRAASEILANEYGDPKDKHTLLEALLGAEGIRAFPALLSTARDLDPGLPSPGQLNHVITAVPQGADGKDWLWLDTAMEVAPFRMLATGLRGKQALVIPMGAPGAGSLSDAPRLVETPVDPPSMQVQEIEITGKVSSVGKLTAHVHYSMTGDNALALRIGFRGTPRTDWKQLGQLLSAGDGFRGEVTDVKSSDPLETRKPFEVDYDISQAKYVDWTRKSLQLRMPLPALGIPEAEESAESNAQPLKLGSPLEVHVRATIELPAGYAPRAPVPVSMSRDFARYRSNYSVKGNTVVAQRDIAFLQREIPAALLLDYGAFAHAAQADEAQMVSIETATKQPPGPVRHAKRPPVAAH